MRLKSVTSILQITKSMKMVASAKYARAERALKATRAIGPSSLGVYQCYLVCGPFCLWSWPCSAAVLRSDCHAYLCVRRASLPNM